MSRNKDTLGPSRRRLLSRAWLCVGRDRMDRVAARLAVRSDFTVEAQATAHGAMAGGGNRGDCCVGSA